MQDACRERPPEVYCLQSGAGLPGLAALFKGAVRGGEGMGCCEACSRRTPEDGNGTGAGTHGSRGPAPRDIFVVSNVPSQLPRAGPRRERRLKGPGGSLP
jgi:hypothetical protein